MRRTLGLVLALPAALMLLGGQVSPAVEESGDQRLVGALRLLPQLVTGSVGVSGVEERDPGVEGGLNRRDTFGVVRGTVMIRHAHQADPDGGHGRPGGAQRAGLCQPGEGHG